MNALVEAAKAGRFPRKFNKRENKIVESVLDSSVKMVPVTWDFAVQGGAVGDIALAASVPAGAVVTAAWCDIETAITGAGTLTLKTSSDVVLSQGLTSGSPATQPSVVASLAVPKKVGVANVSLKVTISSAVLTAGKVTFHVQYV